MCLDHEDCKNHKIAGAPLIDVVKKRPSEIPSNESPETAVNVAITAEVRRKK